MTHVESTIIVPSSQLRQGDIVLTHGMRVLIDRDIRSYDGYGGRTAYSTSGLILNVEEVRADSLVPNSFITDGRWGVQGNDLRTWVVLARPEYVEEDAVIEHEDRDALEPTHSVWDYDVIETTDGDWAHRECVQAKVAGAVARYGVPDDEVTEDVDECGLCDGLLTESPEHEVVRLQREVDEAIDYLRWEGPDLDHGERARLEADLREAVEQLHQARVRSRA